MNKKKKTIVKTQWILLASEITIGHNRVEKFSIIMKRKEKNVTRIRKENIVIYY